MWLSCDRSGFPLIHLPEARLELQFLPVTKFQFERFLAEPNAYGDEWYEQVLAVNPRISYRSFTDSNREQLFMTGILPEEAIAFAKWSGGGLRLPTVSEWRDAYRLLIQTPARDLNLADVPSRGLGEAATLILESLWRLVRPRSLAEWSLMRGGVVEWVTNGSEWIGLGVPRPQFHVGLWDPTSDAVKPIRRDERLPFFGFRLLRGQTCELDRPLGP